MQEKSNSRTYSVPGISNRDSSEPLPFYNAITTTMRFSALRDWAMALRGVPQELGERPIRITNKPADLGGLLPKRDKTLVRIRFSIRCTRNGPVERNKGL